MLAGFVLLFWRVGRNVADITPLMGKIDNLNVSQERTDRSLRDEISRLRSELQAQAQQERAQIAQSIETVRMVVDENLKIFRKTIPDNSTGCVKRLTKNCTILWRPGWVRRFKLVSERLEQVQKGLGEMQNLATGVGDLKKVR